MTVTSARLAVACLSALRALLAADNSDVKMSTTQTLSRAAATPN